MTFLAAVNAFAVVVLVAVTIWYARSTARMMESMNRQSELLSVSVELQAIVAEIQVTQAKTLDGNSLKRLVGASQRIREIRSSMTPESPPALPTS